MNRQMQHDVEQAARWTLGQASAVFGLVGEHDRPGATWWYDDVPPEGGTLRLGVVQTKQAWEIDREGGILPVDEWKVS